MGRTQTLVQLNDRLLAALDQRAAQRGVSRSQVVREAVEAYVASDLEAEISRQIIEGYERQPRAVDEWGDLEAWMLEAARAADRSLSDEEHEEHEAGLPPW